MMDEEQAKALLNCMLRIRYLEKEMANLEHIIEKQREALEIVFDIFRRKAGAREEDIGYHAVCEALALTAKDGEYDRTTA